MVAGTTSNRRPLHRTPHNNTSTNILHRGTTTIGEMGVTEVVAEVVTIVEEAGSKEAPEVEESNLSGRLIHPCDDDGLIIL